MNNKEPIWYDNPYILLTNMHIFVPCKSFSLTTKLNSIVRFLCYFIILSIVFESLNKVSLYMILLILLMTYLLNESCNTNINEPFLNNNTDACTKPTKDNPFMNYTLGDLINNSDRPPACNYDDVKDDIQSQYRKDIYTDSYDLWGKNISDRNFYIMPNTKIVNDQKEFAELCYGNMGECKTTGQKCLKPRGW